jgi:hypoxanthine phosphoribosyltransferase
MIILIPITMLLPSTVLPDGIRVYIIVSLSCFALVLSFVMPQNHPCGIDMSTKKKRFQSTRIPGAGIASIYRVPLRQEGERVKITWTTFIKGLHILKEDLDGIRVPPDMIFGINRTGIIMATYFSLFYGHCPLGIITTGQANSSGKRPTTINWPHLNSIPKQELNILLVDDQIKTGQSARDIQMEILDYCKKNGYPEPYITYIALCGVLEEGKDVTKKEVLRSNDFGWEIDSKYKPAFVAFYLDQPGLKSPEFLR